MKNVALLLFTSIVFMYCENVNTNKKFDDISFTGEGFYNEGGRRGIPKDDYPYYTDIHGNRKKKIIPTKEPVIFVKNQEHFDIEKDSKHLTLIEGKVPAAISKEIIFTKSHADVIINYITTLCDERVNLFKTKKAAFHDTLLSCNIFRHMAFAPLIIYKPTYLEKFQKNEHYQRALDVADKYIDIYVTMAKEYSSNKTREYCESKGGYFGGSSAAFKILQHSKYIERIYKKIKSSTTTDIPEKTLNDDFLNSRSSYWFNVSYTGCYESNPGTSKREKNGFRKYTEKIE